MKTFITVSVDAELAIAARAKKIKFSELFNNTLKIALEMDNANEEGMTMRDKIICAEAKVLNLKSEEKKIEEIKEVERKKRYTITKD